MKEDTFEFKIRDELKMMAEFQDLQSALSKLTRVTRFKEEAAALHKSVSIEMVKVCQVDYVHLEANQ